MIAGLPRRLRLVVGRPGLEPEESAPAPDTSTPPTLEFTAYADDCRASGWIALDGDRLTDMLNNHDELELVDVLVESHEDGRAIELHELLIGRDELYAVKAGGPRGHPGRRIRTRPHPIALRVGPYTVSGYLHALPGTDPIASFRRRNTSMIPLTDASIEYDSPAGRQRVMAETVVVNRSLTDWIAPAPEWESKFPELPQAQKRGGLLKDFTGELSA